MLPDAVSQKLDALPPQPGVYLFKDKKGAVVYVGKAKSLRARVRSYFQDSQGDSRAFIPILQRTIGDLDTIVTANEKEATILENNLVKEHRPRFNVKLRDDKDFITLRLGSSNASEEVPRASHWPRLDVVRRPTPDGGRYFGPYHSATAARRTLHLVNKHFQLRTCSDLEFANRKRPCLQHQIKRWGTADAAYVFFFGLAGLRPGTSLAVCLMYRLFWYLSGVAGAILHMLHRGKPAT